jgi:sulfate permease, SulP family
VNISTPLTFVRRIIAGNQPLKKGFWVSNILSGMTVGVVALPLAMGLAIATGFRPEQGIYTAIVAGLIVALLGGSPIQINGPSGAFIVIVSKIMADHGMAGFQVATLMGGFILLVLGLLRCGQWVRFMPVSVVTGFTSGVGVLIWSSQWEPFLGLPAMAEASIYTKIKHIIEAWPNCHLTTMVLAGFALLLVIILPRIPKLGKIPAPLTVLALCTTLQTVFQFQGVVTIGSRFGGIPRVLPHWVSLPVLPQQLLSLIDDAFVIAFLAGIQSLLCATVTCKMANKPHNANQELIGQGLANMITPLMGGFVSTGAISRTGANIRYGGTAPLSGIVHSVFLLAILWLLAPWAVNVPLYCLASILFVVAYGIYAAGGEGKRFVTILRTGTLTDKMALLATFLLMLFADLPMAVGVGMTLATLCLVGASSCRLSVNADDSQTLIQCSQSSVSTVDGFTTCAIYIIQGNIWFGTAPALQDRFLNFFSSGFSSAKDALALPKIVLFRLKDARFLDISGIEIFHTLIQNLQTHQYTVVLCEACPATLKQFCQAGITSTVGEHEIFETDAKAMASITTMYAGFSATAS